MKQEQLLSNIKPKRIHQLHREVYNQIAAGEVIERPASLVKELVENSIDSGAKKIEVEVLGHDMTTIRVSDDGSGIHKDDLVKSISPHATSKLKQAEDLLQISTLGFRGEALASICSVARIKISSTCHEQHQGWQLQYEPGQSWPPCIQQVGHPVGTTVMVSDLFYNTPARRAFLRSAKTELLQIEDTIKKIAVGNQRLSFKLLHNKKIVLFVPPVVKGSFSLTRLANIFGQEFTQHALSIQEAATELSINGYISEATCHRGQADRQFLYVNGRYIKDKVLQHAVRQAYADYLPAGRFPMFVLFLHLPADKIDVNVHPTKHEIRFKEMRLVHQFVYQALSQIIQRSVAPIDLKQTEVATSLLNVEDKNTQACSIVQTLPPLLGREYVSSNIKFETSLKYFGSFGDDYWFAKQANHLYLIDVHASVSQMVHQILTQRNEVNVVQKQLLLPQSIQVPSNLSINQSKVMTLLRNLKFELVLMGQAQWWLRAMPAVIHETAVSILVSWIEGQFLKAHTGKEFKESVLIKELACLAAPHRQNDLSEEERISLLYFIEKQTPKECCHQRRSWRVMHASQLSNVINSDA